MNLPFPYKIYDSVADITPEELERLRVRGLLLDIDGTLAPTHVKDPAPRLLAWAKQVKEAGVRIFILSNNKSPSRTASYAERIGCDWRHKSKKPSTKGFLAAAAHLGLQPHELAIVGDQIYTDVLGGLRSGMWTLMVQSTDTYLWYFPLRRLAELPFRYERREK